jgi:hypothetical protein
VVLGRMEALTIWSKDRREPDVEDGFDVFLHRAGNGAVFHTRVRQSLSNLVHPPHMYRPPIFS